jgi:hypothetical protein
MPKILDLTGQHYGDLEVLFLVGSNGRGRLWHCRCVCGGETELITEILRDGKNHNCGDRRIHPNHHVHGMSRTPEYETFICARNRCTRVTNSRWKDYGGRGIKFMFTSFEQFFAELGLRPSAQHSIDRKDNDGNYEPGNVKWSTREEQRANQRRSKK